jgi:tRNA(Ile)-lysidine synthase
VATAQQLELELPNVERFRRDLDLLVPAGAAIGVAVSGGPDSLALLVLAHGARPGLVEVATVDHALRAESRGEAEMVGELCERLGVPHSILTVGWAEKPQTALQERARAARYGLLSGWAGDRGLRALLTAHHLDDQAETLLMRLARGAGVKGLAGMRKVARTPGADVPLLRPLLGWRRSELEQVCASAGLTPVADPSNEDEQFERVRTRRALEKADWLDPPALALSAANLAEADAALAWATTQAWERSVRTNGREITLEPEGMPREIRRRIVTRSIASLATEGKGAQLRGPELDRILAALASGGKATVRGVLCTGGRQWRFTEAPPRNN